MLKYIFALLDWCKVVISLNWHNKKVLFNEGEIWWCSIGMNVGVEIYGKGPKFTRPVLIFKKFDSDSFLGIPLTSQIKQGNWYTPIPYGGRDNYALLAQVRVLDVRRLTKKMGTLGDDHFQAVQSAFSRLYDPVLTPENSHPAGQAGIGGKSQTSSSDEDNSILSE